MRRPRRRRGAARHAGILAVVALLGLGVGCGDDRESGAVSAERVKRELRGAVEAATGGVSTQRRLLVEQARLARTGVTASLSAAHVALANRPAPARASLARAIDAAQIARDTLDRRLDRLLDAPPDAWVDPAESLMRAIGRTLEASRGLEQALGETVTAHARGSALETDGSGVGDRGPHGRTGDAAAGQAR
ncbi:MAG: hypothetical protein R3F35_12335 [Myxococcota bacterium]